MHLIKHISFLFLCFLLSVLLSACGSKGDLYHPEETETVEATAVEAHEQVTDEVKKQT